MRLHLPYTLLITISLILMLQQAIVVNAQTTDVRLEASKSQENGLLQSYVPSRLQSSSSKTVAAFSPFTSQSQHTVTYCNNSQRTAEQVVVELVFDPTVTAVRSTQTYQIAQNRLYQYQLGTIKAGECLSFKIQISYKDDRNLVAGPTHFIADKPPLKFKTLPLSLNNLYGKNILTASTQSVYIDELIMDNPYKAFQLRLPYREKSLADLLFYSEYKRPKPLSLQTISANIITQNQVEQWNAITLDQALHKLPGLNVLDNQLDIWGGNGFAYGSGSRVQMLMNDLPILRGDANYTDWNFFPVELIDQVEVMKGAGSALYGSAALNGVINVKTIKAGDKPMTKVEFHTGVYQAPSNNMVNIEDEFGQVIGTTKKAWWQEEATLPPTINGGSLVHSRKIGRLSLVAAGHLEADQSWRKNEFERRGRLSTQLSYTINDRTEIGLNTYFQKNQSRHFLAWAGKDHQLYRHWEDADIITTNGNKLVVDPYLTYENEEQGILHKVQARYYKNDVLNKADQANRSAKSSFADMYYGEYQVQKELAATNMTIIGGVNATLNNVSDSELYLTQPDDNTNNYLSSNVALFLQVNKALFRDRLNLTFGARMERNKLQDLVDTQLPTFKLGANYELTKSTRLRASFSEGYRFPSIAEKYIATSVAVFNTNSEIFLVPNKELQAETGWNAALGIQQNIRLFDWQGYVDASIFANQYNNMIEFTFGNYDKELVGLSHIPEYQGFGFRSMNVGDAVVTGAELSLAGDGKIGYVPMRVMVGYTYLNARYRTDVETLPLQVPAAGPNLEPGQSDLLKYRFKHTFKGDIESKYKSMSLGISANYNSFIEGIDPIFNLLIPDLMDYRADHNHGNWVVNARLTYHFSPNTRFSAHVNNLLNKEYTLRPALIEAPRNFQFKYVYEF